MAKTEFGIKTFVWYYHDYNLEPYHYLAIQETFRNIRWSFTHINQNMIKLFKRTSVDYGYSIWKVGRGSVWRRLFRPTRSDFSLFFLGNPAVIFFPLMQCKKRPVRPSSSDIGTILRPPRSIFNNVHQTYPTNFSNEIALRRCGNFQVLCQIFIKIADNKHKNLFHSALGEFLLAYRGLLHWSWT